MASTVRAEYVLGIDIGGTKLAAGVADSAGKLLISDRIPTDPSSGAKNAIDRLIELCRRLIRESGVPVAAAGVGSVGPLDQQTGRIISPVNMPGWGSVPLVDMLHDGLKIPVYLDNDANAAALGEHLFGAGRGVANMIYLTISTGIGGGVILDGRLYQGSNGNAGELGHMSVDYHGRPCPCGNVGCIEQYASGTAIARQARELLQSSNAPSLMRELAGSIDKVNAKVVQDALEREDRLARQIWDEAMLALGTFLANIIHSFNPQRIVMGGGVTNAGVLLFESVRQITKKRTIPAMMQIVDIVPAQLGDQVGVLGAVAVGQHGWARAAGK